MPRFDVIAGIQRAFTRACTPIPSWAHRAIFRSAGVKHTNWDRQATPAACVLRDEQYQIGPRRGRCQTLHRVAPRMKVRGATSDGQFMAGGDALTVSASNAGGYHRLRVA